MESPKWCYSGLSSRIISIGSRMIVRLDKGVHVYSNRINVNSEYRVVTAGGELGELMPTVLIVLNDVKTYEPVSDNGLHDIRLLKPIDGKCWAYERPNRYSIVSPLELLAREAECISE